MLPADSGKVDSVLHQGVAVYVERQIDERFKVGNLLCLHSREELVLFIRCEPLRPFGKKVKFIQIDLFPIQY